MRRVRVIPTLLLDANGGLVKTVRFGKRTYIGDPINAVKIFNEKEVDELVLLDIDASKQGRQPNYKLIEDIVSEAFMPIGYGGGVDSVQCAQRLFNCGLEKLALCTAPFSNMSLISELASRYGSQSVLACLDIKKSWLGKYQLRSRSGNTKQAVEPALWARRIVEDGAGEILLQSIDRDGTYLGYDNRLLEQISSAVRVPIVASGGARSVGDFLSAIQSGCSAVAAGSMFVYQGASRGILINYPTQMQLRQELFEKL